MRSFILGLLLAMVAGVAWGADGDGIDSCADVGSNAKGDFTSKCFLICDDATSADGDDACDEFSLRTHGRPAYFIVSLETATGCAGNPTAEINFANTSSSARHAEQTLTWGGTTSAVFVGPRQGFITLDFGTMTSCTAVDVAVQLFYER